MPSILTVCTGNVCRSPLAALVLERRLAAHALSVRSAGTHAPVGASVTAETRRLAIDRGVSPDAVAQHRAAVLNAADIEEADLILTMTRGHRRAVADLAPHRQRSTFTIREFSRIVATMSDTELRAGLDDVADASARVRAMAAVVAHRRGFAPRPDRPEDDDVDDPIGGTWEDYLRSAGQLEPAVDAVARAVGVALR